MGIKMVRIDDRLIHGQIVAAWAKSLSIQRIWIIDDAVAKNQFLINVMKMVAPPDTELQITGTDKIPSLASEYDKTSMNTLVLVKTPEVAEKLFDSNISFRELNVGGMGASATRTKLFKNISASEEERKTLDRLQEKGVTVYFQVTPNDKKTNYS